MFSRQFLNVTYKVSSKSHLTIQKISSYRSLHVACRNLKRDFTINNGQSFQNRTQVVSATFIRYISNSQTNLKTEDASFITTEQEISVPKMEYNSAEAVEKLQVDDILSQIPDPPALIPTDVLEVVVSEPTLQSLGLGSNWPSGLVQQLLDIMHSSLGIPWWGTIVITTICARSLLLPIVIKIQKYTANMHNVQPQIQYLQEQLAEARKMQDHFEVARIANELYTFMKDKGIDPIKNAGLPLIQAPVFLSFFWALRGMVNAPIESMKEGGMLWFTDLTIPDPYYILPILTSTTMFVTLELGTDTMKSSTMGNMRYVLRAVPIIMFPFIMNFEGAILCYWVSTNIFSLIQVKILRIPKVREYFKIPAMVKHDIKKLPVRQKKFVEGFKDSWTNMKVARELNSRQMYDEIVFEKAGKGPVPKTYKYDPTKPQATNAFLSKKRD